MSRQEIQLLTQAVVSLISMIKDYHDEDTAETLKEAKEKLETYNNILNQQEKLVNYTGE